MKKRLLRSVLEYIRDNKYQYAVVIAALIVGVVLGTVAEISLGGEQYESLSGYMDNFVSAYNLQPVSKGGVFMSSLKSNIKTVFLLWLSGLWVGLIPFSIFQIGIKGYKLGFSVAFLVSAYKGKGILFAVMSLFPQVMIVIPALTVYAVFNIKYAMSLRRLHGHNKNSEVRRDMYFRNFLCILGVGIIVFICSLIDAFVIPPMLKPICSYLAV